MFVTRISIITGKTNTMDLPVTSQQIALLNSPGAPLIQEIFPDLTHSQREFLLSGITEEEWDKYMKEPEEKPESPSEGTTTGEPGSNCPHGNSWGSGCMDCTKQELEEGFPHECDLCGHGMCPGCSDQCPRDCALD